MTRGFVGVNKLFVYRGVNDGHRQFVGRLGGALVAGLDGFDYGLNPGAEP